MYKKFFVREYIRKIINEIIDKSEDDEFDDINLSDHKNYSNWVFIHRNLNKPPYWSIKRGKSGGNVIGYDKTIKLKDVEFKVQKGGQSRVRKEKRKNVHAGVVGKIIDSGKNYNTKGWTLVTYNPYVNNTFVEYETGKPIHNAKEAILKNTKEVWVKKEDEDILEEKWSNKYKKSIDCKNPKGFSQRAHCQGRKKKELDEYGRTLKMARRQGSGTRFPKSVIKTNPSRFRKYSRLKESNIEKLDLDKLEKKRQKIKKILIKLIDRIMAVWSYNRDKTKIFMFDKNDVCLLDYDISNQKLWYDHKLYEDHILKNIKVDFYLGSLFKEALKVWFENEFKEEGYKITNKWWSSAQGEPHVEGANIVVHVSRPD